MNDLDFDDRDNTLISYERFEDGSSGIAWCQIVPLLRWVGRPDSTATPEPTS